LGYRSDDLIGQSVYEYYHALDSEDMEKAYKNCMYIVHSHTLSEVNGCIVIHDTVHDIMWEWIILISVFCTFYVYEVFHSPLICCIIHDKRQQVNYT